MTVWQDWPIEQIKSNEAGFLKRLKNIQNPVKKLYFRGTWNIDIFDKCLAVVGSRRNTKYGEQIIKMMIPSLVLSKISIVSGFMYGIDSLAHTETIECGGKTIAVLGCGLDVIYPIRNNVLYSQILESGGLIVSEYEPKTKPALWTFPQRNRIVVGMANLGVLVVEAGVDSGSLVTARIAGEEKKKVFCIPGPINSKVSAGCNLWIRTNKAKMVTEPEDILGGRKIKQVQSCLFDNKNKIEKKIIKLIENEALSLDELVVKTGFNVSELSIQLSVLQMSGRIEEMGGKYYLI